MLRNLATSVAGRDQGLELYRMQAEIAKALANPLRLRILSLMGTDEVSYGSLRDRLGVSKPNLSQHLAVLRKSGIVTVRRVDGGVHYRLTLPEITDLCAAMRDLLAKHLAMTHRQAARLLGRRGAWPPGRPASGGSR
jgi:ArsR family transcriptional regulator